MAQAVLAQWKELKPSYRIPKAKKQVSLLLEDTVDSYLKMYLALRIDCRWFTEILESSVISKPVSSISSTVDAVSTPVDEPSSFMSPSESVGSGSAEGLGKRQYDDEDRSSTPAGIEKRSRFDVAPSQTPTDDNDPSATLSEQGPKYQNHPYDSPDYFGRSEPHRLSESYSRSGEGYDRESREGRMDVYGRLESHGRDGGYSRPPEAAYGRSDSYGRSDPYAESKSHYERGRYEHYRSDRDRGRDHDRYYDYYRERDYDRDYRSHRDQRDLRDSRDPRAMRDDRESRDYREMRDSGRYNPTPPSPRNRDRDLSPGPSNARDRSPSDSTRQSSWTGDRSRSISPSKENEAIDANLQSTDSTRNASHENGVAPLSISSDVPAAAATVSAADDSTAQSATSVPGVDTALVAPSLTRKSTLPSDQQDANALSGEQRVANAQLASAPSTAGTEPHPRSISGHSDYAHYRYGSHGSGRDYHHSQYYRHSSSSYPHYSKSRHDYRPNPRAYAPQTNPAPPVELPPNWSKASDPEGRVYYYNEITRATQWEPPALDPVAAALPSTTATQLSATQLSATHYPAPRNVHQPHYHQQPVLAARAASPEPRKPVNIDGFTQEQIQEVIGRAYDKQKQKNLANGMNSASGSVHDVDSPHNRAVGAHSPSMVRTSGVKALKPMEKRI